VRGTKTGSGVKPRNLSVILGRGERVDRLEDEPGNNVVGARMVPQPLWCLAGLTKTQQRRLHKLCKGKIGKEKAEKERDEWYNQARSMITVKNTWREKRLTHEERDGSEEIDLSSGDDNQQIGVDMAFELRVEFQAPEAEVAKLALGAKVAIFQKPDRLGIHMKLLFIKGYLQGKPAQRMMVDGGAGVNAMPLATFDKMGYREDDLMRTNTSLSAFIS
jgi:hypothetical protein